MADGRNSFIFTSRMQPQSSFGATQMSNDVHTLMLVQAAEETK